MSFFFKVVNPLLVRENCGFLEKTLEHINESSRKISMSIAMPLFDLVAPYTLLGGFEKNFPVITQDAINGIRSDLYQDSQDSVLKQGDDSAADTYKKYLLEIRDENPRLAHFCIMGFDKVLESEAFMGIIAFVESYSFIRRQYQLDKENQSRKSGA